jgi:hypothetical protein
LKSPGLRFRDFVEALATALPHPGMQLELQPFESTYEPTRSA